LGYKVKATHPPRWPARQVAKAALLRTPCPAHRALGGVARPTTRWQLAACGACLRYH
jgi:hypothetical protein